jgi:SOS response associated peptidase (SRAP)
MHRAVAKFMIAEHAATGNDYLELVGLVEVRRGDGARTLLDQEGHRVQRIVGRRPLVRRQGVAVGADGTVNLAGRGMLVVSVTQRLGSERSSPAYCVAHSKGAGQQKGALSPLSWDNAGNSLTRSRSPTAVSWPSQAYGRTGSPPAGEWVLSLAVITTAPNELCAELHNRLPVVLRPETWPVWLGEQPAELPQLKALLAPYPSEDMICWPVSASVGNVKNNDSGLIEPIAAA